MNQFAHAPARIRIGNAQVSRIGSCGRQNSAARERSLAGVPHTVVQDQEAIVDLCAANGMAFLRFFPLALPGEGQPGSPALTGIASRHRVTQAQVAIAWLPAR